MTPIEIVHVALTNLEHNALVEGKWKAHVHDDVDGELTLTINKHRVRYNADIKKEVRNNQLFQIITLNNKYTPFILIAGHIFPKVKEELRKNNVAYLEANGNIFLKDNGNLLWIDTAKPLDITPDAESRAFAKTGLKVLFYFLLNDENINHTYRKIAEQTGTTIGNINKIITGLKQDGFLLAVNKTEHKIVEKKKLLDKWIEAYETKLKPNLKIGTFRFLNRDDFLKWKELDLNAGTFWGGEPAGDVYTNYLKPEILTLYTEEARMDMIKNYRLIPDKDGNVQVYEKFWREVDNKKNAVPPLLAYADLVNTGDGRCMEVAKRIYDELLAKQF